MDGVVEVVVGVGVVEAAHRGDEMAERVAALQHVRRVADARLLRARNRHGELAQILLPHRLALLLLGEGSEL